jgi:carbon monoxide dehydrogenase subunit G
VKLAGSVVLPGAPEDVWNLLTDPRRLVKCLPGAETLEPDGIDRYRVVVKFGIAAISGNYSGTIELKDKNPPRSLRLRMEGKGTPGFVTGEGKLDISEHGGKTQLDYAGEAQVGGLIASVGQRMIEATAKKIVQQFFANAADELRSSKA